MYIRRHDKPSVTDGGCRWCQPCGVAHSGCENSHAHQLEKGLLSPGSHFCRTRTHVLTCPFAGRVEMANCSQTAWRWPIAHRPRGDGQLLTGRVEMATSRARRLRTCT